jgi:S1-C subfamily serine protease
MNRTVAILLGLLLLAVSHGGATAQWPVNEAQRKKALQPALNAATECMVRHSLDHAGILEAYGSRGQNLKPVIDSVWPLCESEINRLSREYADLYGWGKGYVYVDGPFRTGLPKAIKDPLERRIAAMRAAEDNAKAFAAQLYKCIDGRLVHLVSSSESAELLAATAMMNCGREVTAAIDSYLDALRTRPGFNEADARNLRLEARNNFHAVALARAVEVRADEFRASKAPRAAPSQPAAPAPEAADRQSGSSGTGFVVSEQGHVLTNAHVVKACAEPTIFTSDVSVVKGRVLAKDERNDLAVIGTTIRPAYVPLFRTTVKLGESVFVFGYPLAGLLSSSGNFSAGNVAAISGMADDSTMLQISAPVQPGNSGGPLLDEAGNVVGVVVGKMDAFKFAAVLKDIPQNINFAIRGATAATFLQANHISVRTGDPGPRRESPEIADQARRISVRIECAGAALPAPARPKPTGDAIEPNRVRTAPVTSR